MHACMLSWLVVSDSLWPLAHKAPLSMKFARQEYWSGLPFPSPGDLPDPGIEPAPPALYRFFITGPSGKIMGQRWHYGKGPICQCRSQERLQFNPWLGKIPWKEGMTTHSSLAWSIPWTEEPGRLQLMGLQRVGYNWSNLAHTHIISKQL